jgi:hypothetical protein
LYGRENAAAVDKTAVEARDIAIVTMIGETTVKAYSDYSVYQQLGQLTLQRMVEYSTRWGHPLFFLHANIMDQGKQPYWAKIALMEHYLSLGYKYVLYTDIDVLFLQMDVPLSKFIVPGKHIISVDECTNRNDTRSLIRSGFMILHNSPATFTFLKHWRESHRYFEHVENPEQSALELLASLPQFAPIVHLHGWRSFHAYDLCDGYHSAFSLHFPGPHKVARVGRVMAWFDHHWPLQGTAGDQSLTTLLGGLPSVEKLAADLTKADHDRSNPSVVIYDSAQARAKSCLASAQALGYHVEPYNQAAHRNVLEYDVAGVFFNIPTVIYITVPDAARIPKQVAHNIDTRRTTNPDFQVVIYDDQGIETLVAQFLDLAHEVWQSLLLVQKTDIWRYLVVYLFGGWYLDSDVECVRPIRQWGHKPSDTLVVGVELSNLRGPIEGYTGQRGVVFAQYAFGAAARHPAVGGMLASILKRATSLGGAQHLASAEDRLRSVLATTGPWTWTDAVANYICYGDSYPRQTCP